MISQLSRLRLIALILVYLIAASLTFIDKFEFVNDMDWGLNHDYWGSNSQYLASIIFWLNLFLYSILPVILSISLKDKIAIIASLSLPIYWGLQVFRTVTNTGHSANVAWPDFKYYVYTLVIASTIAILAKVIVYVYTLKIGKKFDTLEKQIARAKKKLEKLNNEGENIISRESYDDAMEFLKKASLVDDENTKQYNTRMALFAMQLIGDEIERKKKKIGRISTFSELQKGPE